MRHKKRRVFLNWNFDKEENWLNEMSDKGLHLISVGLATYIFEEGKPCEYIYRKEAIEKSVRHEKSIEYIRFMEDTGVEQIGNVDRWVYFRRKASEGPFEIYSDKFSKINQLKRIRATSILAMIVGINSIMQNIFNVFNINRYNVSDSVRTVSILGLGVGILVLLISIIGFIRISFKIGHISKLEDDNHIYTEENKTKKNILFVILGIIICITLMIYSSYYIYFQYNKGYVFEYNATFEEMNKDESMEFEIEENKTIKVKVDAKLMEGDFALKIISPKDEIAYEADTKGSLSTEFMLGVYPGTWTCNFAVVNGKDGSYVVTGE